MVPPVKCSRVSSRSYEFWPSDLQRAGHTTVQVDEDEPLGQHLKKIGKHEVYGVHMAMQKLPCKLVATSKFRNGKDRWWCPVHQGSYGKKAQVDEIQRPNDYCELGIWIGLAPAIDTYNTDPKYFYAGIHVHGRKEAGGKKVIDKNFPAVRISDRTGRFPNIPETGILVTTPAALEYLYYMEHQCPVNKELGVESLESQGVPRSSVELTAIIKCKHCGALHEDIGDFFGENLHKKHLCGTCGRDIFGKLTIGNPLQLFARPWRREIVGGAIDPQNKEIHLKLGMY